MDIEREEEGDIGKAVRQRERGGKRERERRERDGQREGRERAIIIYASY